MRKTFSRRTRYLLQAQQTNLRQGDQSRSFASTEFKSSTSPYELKPKHANFEKLQASRPEFDRNLPIAYTKTPNPGWKNGEPPHASLEKDKKHVEIDPLEAGRPMISNYKLLVSGVPRPISLVSTISKDGKRNLAPMSYFQIVDHDPPTFIVSFTGRSERPKDTQRNLEETRECVINVVSEQFIEAVNATSVDIPHGESEWDVSGFHAEPSSTVAPERVKEAIFSIEGKLLEMKSLDYHGAGTAGKPFGSMAIIQATRFWVREDAINEARDEIYLSVMRPSVQLGGIQYGRIRETFELPRPSSSKPSGEKR